jgi:hypothetical protein
MINEILQYRAVVQLSKPANGFWDGGAKDRFEFTPSLERTPGKPAIRWGCWGANLWFVVNADKSIKSHFAQLRRKLRGGLNRTITIEKIS